MSPIAIYIIRSEFSYLPYLFVVLYRCADCKPVEACNPFFVWCMCLVCSSVFFRCFVGCRLINDFSQCITPQIWLFYRAKALYNHVRRVILWMFWYKSIEKQVCLWRSKMCLQPFVYRGCRHFMVHNSWLISNKSVWGLWNCKICTKWMECANR